MTEFTGYVVLADTTGLFWTATKSWSPAIARAINFGEDRGTAHEVARTVGGVVAQAELTATTRRVMVESVAFPSHNAAVWVSRVRRFGQQAGAPEFEWDAARSRTDAAMAADFGRLLAGAIAIARVL